MKLKLKAFAEMLDTYENDPGAWLRQAIKNGTNCINCNLFLSKVDKLNPEQQEQLTINVFRYMVKNYNKNDYVDIESSEWRNFFDDRTVVDLQGGRRRRRRRSRRKRGGDCEDKYKKCEEDVKKDMELPYKDNKEKVDKARSDFANTSCFNKLKSCQESNRKNRGKQIPKEDKYTKIIDNSKELSEKHNKHMQEINEIKAKLSDALDRAEKAEEDKNMEEMNKADDEIEVLMKRLKKLGGSLAGGKRRRRRKSTKKKKRRKRRKSTKKKRRRRRRKSRK